MSRFIAFFMTVIAFFSSLFGAGSSPKIYSYDDLSYGSHSRQKLDLRLPEAEDGGEIGLILMIHGGGWDSGDKNDYNSYLNDGANKGYACAAMNYRYAGDGVNAGDIMDDIDLALTKIAETAAENDITISKVMLTGYSAGGHLALFYSYTRKATAPIEPVAVASFAGPTDLADPEFYINNALGSPLSICKMMSKVCGYNFTPSTMDAAKPYLDEFSPLYYVDENTVPTLLLHGKKDLIVPYSNAESLATELARCGVTHELISYANSGHKFGLDPSTSSAADAATLRYAETYLK